MIFIICKIGIYINTFFGGIIIKRIEDNEFLSGIIKEFQIEIPTKFSDLSIYKEIENFKDAEYIYCIAYEMLIRTDEYNLLLEEYELLKNKSKYDMTNNEFSKLRELIAKMNTLGLKKTSFLGFDCDDYYDHVFKRIEYYNEVINSPWNVRIVQKFKIDPSLEFNNVLHMLIDFYLKKEELYIPTNLYYHLKLFYKNDVNYNKSILSKVVDFAKSSERKFKELIKNKSEDEIDSLIPLSFNPPLDVNKINIVDLSNVLSACYILCNTENSDKKIFKLLSDDIYLKELDEEFLSLLKEKKDDDSLIKTKSEFPHYNKEFWNKYCVNDIKDGLEKLIEYHLNNNLIYDQNIEHINVSKKDILKNYSDFYIPCVNRLIDPETFEWKRSYGSIQDDNFIKQLEYNGLKSIVGDKGYITLKKEENIYLVQLSEYISLDLLEDSFLETLTFEDLKNTYIDTEPVFSRPRLMFDEARLTNIPINLNLSKEDLLLYISQIKDDYNRDKKIVKTNEEYFFDLPLKIDEAKMPIYIKHANEKRTSNDKKQLPVKRQAFVKSITFAFYIYDLYKFFIPLFERKRKLIRQKRKSDIEEVREIAKREGTNINQTEILRIRASAKDEIRNYSNNNLITLISHLFINELSESKVEEYLITMKEFIHGVNKNKENNILKKKYDLEEKYFEPKYKNLIIGDSYIIKSNKRDLIEKLEIN